MLPFKVATSLFLVIIFTFTTVVKPATALSIDFNGDNDPTELYETAKKVGQTAIAKLSRLQVA